MAGDHASDTPVAVVRLAGTTQGGVQVVALTGELDLVSHQPIVDLLGGVIDRHGADLVVDLAGVTFCDSRGMSALVRVANLARRRGGQVWCTGVPPRVERLLRLTGLHERLQVTPCSVN